MGFARIQPWVSTACRLVLAGVWIVAGASKVGDLAESGRAVAAYRVLPYDVATFVGAVLPLLEIALGLLLLPGFWWCSSRASFRPGRADCGSIADASAAEATLRVTNSPPTHPRQFVT